MSQGLRSSYNLIHLSSPGYRQRRQLTELRLGWTREGVNGVCWTRHSDIVIDLCPILTPDEKSSETNVSRTPYLSSSPGER